MSLTQLPPDVQYLQSGDALNTAKVRKAINYLLRQSLQPRSTITNVTNNTTTGGGCEGTATFVTAIRFYASTHTLQIKTVTCKVCGLQTETDWTDAVTFGAFSD